MAINDLQILLNQIKLEDTTELLLFINKANTENLTHTNLSKYLKELPEHRASTITNNQLKLLKTMGFRGGYTLYMYKAYRDPTPPPTALSVRYLAITTAYNFIHNNLARIPAEDLIYFSNYHKSKWKKVNPSRKNTKGTQFTFQMNTFSLQIFKGSIKKEFLRTEAKNFILKVNMAYKDSPKTIAEIRIRNKFYALILNNTPVHTRVMLDLLHLTNIDLGNERIYDAHEDEALAISLGYAGHPMSAYNTSNTMSTYSTDVTLVTHNNGLPGDRDNERLTAGASILLTAYARSGNEAYHTLAQRMLANIDKATKTTTLNNTKAIEALRTILKEPHE